MARLEILSGLDGTESVSFDNEIILGRSPDNAVCLPDYRISRQHARIRRQGTSYLIEDLNSTNGILLSGTRIPPRAPHKLNNGDEIRICSALLVFHNDAPETAQHLTENDEPHTEATDITSNEVPLKGKSGTLSLTILRDEARRPHVEIALDASANMMQVDDDEKKTGKGLQDALKRLEAICRVSTLLGEISDREKLLQRILDCVFDIFPAAERSFIMLQDKNTKTLMPVLAKTREETFGEGEEIAISHTIVNEVVTHKRSVLSFDAMGDERFHEQASVINLSIRSMMCAPLLAAEELLGLIQVDTRTGVRSFIPRDLHILTGISAQAAIAIKNMQLYEAVETETARRTSLERYFSPGLVEMLMSGNLTTALGGSAYKGTVLFSDIIGFTAMSETMSPAEVVTRLNRYFTVMQKLIYDNGGNVDKFSGDAIMAFWGVPHASEYDTHRAVLTALRMQEKLWFLNLVLESEGQQSIYMGVGLSSGEFIAGNIGSEDKIEFTLIGDTVNLASRIETLAGRSQVFVSETVWSTIKDTVCAIQLPPIMLKGKSKPITIYSIRSIQDNAHGRCALALPCELFDIAGNLRGHGIITQVKGTASDFEMLMSTNVLLASGDGVTINLTIVEYHQSLRFSATVVSCYAASYDNTNHYTKAVLSDISDTAISSFLTPGNCLVTTYSWQDMDRY